MSYVEQVSEAKKVRDAQHLIMRGFSGSRPKMFAASELLDYASQGKNGEEHPKLKMKFEMARDAGISEADANALVDIGRQMQRLIGPGKA